MIENTISPTSTALNEKTFLALQSAQARLEGIKSGLLGQEYAENANALCSADYTVAKNKGMIDLCDQLQKSLVAAPYMQDPRATGKKPNINPTIQDVKDSIDSLNRNLTRYLSKG